MVQYTWSTIIYRSVTHLWGSQADSLAKKHRKAAHTMKNQFILTIMFV